MKPISVRTPKRLYVHRADGCRAFPMTAKGASDAIAYLDSVPYGDQCAAYAAALEILSRARRISVRRYTRRRSYASKLVMRELNLAAKCDLIHAFALCMRYQAQLLGPGRPPVIWHNGQQRLVRVV